MKNELFFFPTSTKLRYVDIDDTFFGVSPQSTPCPATPPSTHQVVPLYNNPAMATPPLAVSK